jgi:hypothetical protein
MRDLEYPPVRQRYGDPMPGSGADLLKGVREARDLARHPVWVMVDTRPGAPELEDVEAIEMGVVSLVDSPDSLAERRAEAEAEFGARQKTRIKGLANLIAGDEGLELPVLAAHSLLFLGSEDMVGEFVSTQDGREESTLELYKYTPPANPEAESCLVMVQAQQGRNKAFGEARGFDVMDNLNRNTTYLPAVRALAIGLESGTVWSLKTKESNPDGPFGRRTILAEADRGDLPVIDYDPGRPVLRRMALLWLTEAISRTSLSLIHN